MLGAAARNRRVCVILLACGVSRRQRLLSPDSLYATHRVATQRGNPKIQSIGYANTPPEVRPCRPAYGVEVVEGAAVGGGGCVTSGVNAVSAL